VSKVAGVECPELTGLDVKGNRLEGHQHASLLPLDTDRDGQIDHVLVHAPMGLGVHAQCALRSLKRTHTKGNEKLSVTLAGLGMLDDFRRLGHGIVPELKEAQVWTSRTPFVPPRHLKAKRHTLEDQIQAELRTRGLPYAAAIETFDREHLIGLGFHHFVRARRDSRRAPPTARFFGLRLTFNEPVRGPVLLGYGSHFGLGVFEGEL
jgi:CRISPR-associated protein Csb2